MDVFSLTTVGVLLGGLGLFLVGMHLMTEGLTQAAGPGLRVILASGTKTPFRGVLSGALLTSVVQASAAVTIATIGFVNAGLMTLRQAVTVIYGSNVGTTVTAWLVALVGINFDLKSAALPLIGIGMLLRVTAARKKMGALGEAAAGFGLFFLGIELLKSTFTDFGVSLAGHVVATDGVGAALFFLALGFAITVLMQSSSAAIAVVLTASAGGVLALAPAAAMVIGANVGTTVTAALSVIGATPNAQRTAAAHVVFNLVTGVVALLLLPWLVDLIVFVRSALGLEHAAAPVLAAFHTVFNVLGVALMWGLTPRLVSLLEQRFRSAEEDESRPQFLDRNVVSSPALALRALILEVSRIGEIVRRMGQGALSTEIVLGERLAVEKGIVDRLVDAVGDYSQTLQSATLSDATVTGLEEALRVMRYHAEQAELAQSMAQATTRLPSLGIPSLEEELARFRATVVDLLSRCEGVGSDHDWKELQIKSDSLQSSYTELKSHFLRAGAEGKMPVRRMVDYLDTLSDVRRLAEQTFKAASHMRNLSIWMEPRAAAKSPEPTPLAVGAESDGNVAQGKNSQSS